MVLFCAREDGVSPVTFKCVLGGERERKSTTGWRARIEDRGFTRDRFFDYVR